MSSKKTAESDRSTRFGSNGSFESSSTKRDDTDDTGPKRRARSGGGRPQSKAARTLHQKNTHSHSAELSSKALSDEEQTPSPGVYASFEIPRASAPDSDPLLQLMLSHRPTTAFASPGTEEGPTAWRTFDVQQHNLELNAMRNRAIFDILQSQHLEALRISSFMQSQQHQPPPTSLQNITSNRLREFLQSPEQQHQRFCDPSSLLLGMPESSLANNAQASVLLEQLLLQRLAAATPPSASHQHNVLQQLLLQQLTGISNLQQPHGAGVLGNPFGAAAASFTGSAGLQHQPQQQLPHHMLESLLQYKQQSQHPSTAPQAQVKPAMDGGQKQAPTSPQTQEQQQQPKPLAANQQPVSQSKGIPLALPSDVNHLSGYQIFIRHQLEFFVSEQSDCDTNVQGRKKCVKLSQIGIRCRHCAHTPLRQRGRGSVYYPQKLSGVYQAAQNMATTHLAISCLCFSERMRQELSILHQRKDTAAGGKVYWADACRRMGMVDDDDDGIHFVSDEATEKALAGDFDVDDKVDTSADHSKNPTK